MTSWWRPGNRRILGGGAALDEQAADRNMVGVLKPYEQRALINLVLQRAEVNERKITLEVYALTATKSTAVVDAEGAVVRMRPIGSPGRIRTYDLAVNSRPLYR